MLALAKVIIEVVVVTAIAGYLGANEFVQVFIGLFAALLTIYHDLKNEIKALRKELQGKRIITESTEPVPH